MKYLLIIWLSWSIVGCSQDQTSSPQEANIDLQGTLVTYKNINITNKSLSPVSITKYAENFYLIANYNDIFLLDSQDGNLSRLEVDHPFRDSDKLDDVVYDKNLTYIPTGLFYSEKNQSLYVANYKGNNVLIFKVDIQSHRLNYIGEIKSKHTIGPENVFVSQDGERLVCANYDGNNVTLFIKTSEGYRELWSTNIGQAHGVCINGDYVYVTGLTERKLYKIDIRTGKIMSTLGIQDSDPKKNGFLWPTSVYPLNNNMLVASDAHTGYIYIINADNMKIEKYFGGNGPTYKFLHMPYSIMINNGKYLIASTFQNRIVIGDTSTWQAQKSFVLSGNNWKSIGKVKSESFIAKYDIYEYKSGPRIDIFGQKYYLGFGHLFPVNKNKPVLRLPDIYTINNDSAYLYFTDALMLSPQEYILFSPQSNAAYYSLVYNKISYLIPFKLDSSDYWKVGKQLISSHQQFDTKTIINRCKEIIIQLDDHRQFDGSLSTEIIWQLVYNHGKRPFLSYSKQEFEKHFKEIFKSSEGKNFIAAFMKYKRTPKPSKDTLRQIAFDYYKQAFKNAYADINEIMFVQMLTGFHDFDALAE